MFGDRIVRAFGELKALFDPARIGSSTNPVDELRLLSPFTARCEDRSACDWRAIGTEHPG
jgi:hypothetical protein